jgi:serine/threonine protein kinase
MALKPQQLLEALSHNDLLSEAELKRLSDRFAEQPDASVAEACEELLQRGLLTAYQVQVLVHGRNDPLQLGNYIIFDEIGAGGMGRVYKAYHRRMDRMVALKVIKSETVGSTVAAQRFQQEVKMAARLHHPNIVTAYDANESDGVQYLVMEYVEGQDLGSLVRQGGPLPVNLAVDYLLQAAQGLAYAHTNGVIHRDIKPGNLLLDQHGVVKVLDMGLARTLGDANRDAETNGRAELTATGMVFGTVDYISPEQALSARRADGRSDIYSLGCCLHFFLTGRPMYQGETLVEVLMMHREADIPSLRGIRDDVPESLVAIFERMVAKEPDDRYASMTEVVHDLRELTLSTQLAQEAPTINTVSPLSSSVSWSGPRAKTIAVDRAQSVSRKRLAVMLAAVSLILVAGVVLVAAFYNRNNTAEQDRQQTQSVAPTLAQLVEQVEPAVVRLEVQGSPSSIGSGFLVDADGTVVTNFHVISGARGIVAKFHDGASTSALGIEPSTRITIWHC